MAAKYRDLFTEGDQSEENRRAFWNAGFQVCIKCGKRDIKRESKACGAQGNGQMYGTEIFQCNNKACGWKTSFYYDDSCSPWHYETKDWKRTVKFYTAGLMLLWAKKRCLSDEVVEKVKEKKVDGETILNWHKEGVLGEKLAVSDKNVEKLAKAIEMQKTVI